MRVSPFPPLSLALAVTFFLFPFLAAAQIELPGEKKVTATLVSESNPIAAGQAFRVALTLTHQDHWHVYGKTLPAGTETGRPTKVTWQLLEGWKVEDLPWPATKELDSTGGEKVQGYEGTVHLPFRLTPPANLAPDATVKIEGFLDALVCNPETCMPVNKLPFSVELKTAAQAAPNGSAKSVFQAVDSSATSNPDDSGNDASKGSPSASAGAGDKVAPPGLLLMLCYGFLGGLILNIMPCVFPVLGIKITSVASQAHGDKRLIALHGVAYTLGVLVSFWILVALLQIFHVSWGGQFQSPLFVYGVVLLLTVFGLNMAGLFEVGTSAVGVGSSLTRESGLKGSFFTGLLATIVSTPCSAPLLATALPFGLGLPLFGSLGFFTVIALGLALPYLILSISPGLLRLLPRPGVWMESFKQAMSFLMLGAAAFFVWTLQGQISETAQRDLLLGLVAVALACWVYGRWFTPVKPNATRVKALVIAIAIFALGVWWGWPQPKESQWQAWTPQLVQELRKEGKPVYIDFTARWCATCQVNKRVYKDADLQKTFKDRGIELVKADWTNYDESITKELAALGHSAVPVNALYLPGQDKPVILPNILTVANVQEALSQVPAKK